MMKKEFQLADRREFIAEGLRSAALLTVLAAESSQAAKPAATPNPFAYDVSRISKTDPKLVAYDEVARWKPAYPDARRITVGPQDQVCVCAGHYITVLDRNGQRQMDIALADAARCVGLGDDGSIYAGLRDHVEVFDRQGRRVATWESPGKKAWITGLAIGKNDVFAADSGGRMVWRYDRSGKLKQRIGERNKDRDIPGFVIPSPYLDVELARDGALRVNNPGRHRVEAYTVEGELAHAWGQPGTGIQDFCGCCNPIGLAMLPDGRFVTCEKGLPRVKIYSTDGRFESVVAGTEAFPENARACSDLNDCTRGGMDAAVDSTGRIYILDFIAGDVRVMQRKGALHG